MWLKKRYFLSFSAYKEPLSFFELSQNIIYQVFECLEDDFKLKLYLFHATFSEKMFEKLVAICIKNCGLEEFSIYVAKSHSI